MSMDYNNIKIKKHGDKNITIYYQDYVINTNVDMENQNRNKIPSVDSNGKKIGLGLRNELVHYLNQNCDLLSLPDNCIPIEVDEVKEYFNFSICDEINKENIIKKKYLVWVIFALFFLIIFVVIAGIEFVIKHFISNQIILYIIFSIILLVIAIVYNERSKAKDRMKKVYSVRVYIFDKKIYYGEDTSYYVRIWNNKKHVLMKWFPTSKQICDNVTGGTLFLFESDEGNEVLFEPDNINN